MAVQYENAPITEALIDIRVETFTPTPFAALEAIHTTVLDAYPGKKKRGHFEGQFLVGEEFGARAKHTQMGFQFESADSKQIFQARRDGFTFSRLRPYQNWQVLRDEARRLWDIYRAAVNPLRITRVGVRYINQIDIPMPGYIDYKDYFRTTPEVAPDLPQTLNGFFMRLAFSHEEFPGALMLTQAPTESNDAGIHPVILDLDAFIEPADIDLVDGDARAWSWLEYLRNRKNLFFERSLTDKSKALFGPKREY